MVEVFTSVDFWKLVIPLLGAVGAWVFNEWRKRELEQYARKVSSYKELVLCLRGFYEGAEDAARLKADFLDQLNLCWLYCPDEVIKIAYEFLDTVHDSQKRHDEVKERAMGELVAAIRKDLLSRKLVSNTGLSGQDFRHLGLR